MHRYISSVCLLMIALMLTFSFTGFAEPATPLNQTALTLVREDASLSSIGAFLDGLSGIHGVTFQSGDNNNGVKALQEALIASGYLDRGRDDGQYGKKTVAAVEKFQAAVGLPVTGKADLATQFTLAMSGDGLTVGEDGAYVAKVKHFAFMILPDQCFYIGALNSSGNMIKGTYYYANGNYYAGEFRHNVRSGKGTAYFKNGDVYVGEWKNDVMEGNGIYYFGGMNSTERYDGQWANNAMNGKGTYTLPNGKTITGKWVDNQHKKW